MLLRLIAMSLLTLAVACSPVDKQFQNRQVAYIDIQPGPKMDAMQAAQFRNALQPALIGRVQGRGQLPAVGMTVVILSLEMPNGQNTANYILGYGGDAAGVIGEVQLWDSTTRALLTKFSFGGRIAIHHDTMFSDAIGYSREPKNISDVYNQLARNAAEQIGMNMYGSK